MRIVFFGTPELAVPTLRECAAHHAVTAVVCQPDRPKGRSKKPVPPPVKAWALEREFPVHQPTRLNDGTFESWLREQAPDVCVLAAYGRILKQPILDVPVHGFLNMHPSLLPKYRGPSPIQSAIINGDPETGISIIRLSMDMDAGDIALQTTEPIQEDDDGVTLSERLSELGATLMIDALQQLSSDSISFRKQNDADATYCKLLSKEDGRINWHESALAIHDRIRGALPWPGAFTSLEGETIKIFKSKPATEPATFEPGTIVSAANGEIRVATGDGVLSITNLQAPGKKAMEADVFLRGRPLESGMQFGNAS